MYVNMDMQKCLSKHKNPSHFWGVNMLLHEGEWDWIWNIEFRGISWLLLLVVFFSFLVNPHWVMPKNSKAHKQEVWSLHVLKLWENVIIKKKSWHICVVTYIITTQAQVGNIVILNFGVHMTYLTEVKAHWLGCGCIFVLHWHAMFIHVYYVLLPIFLKIVYVFTPNKDHKQTSKLIFPSPPQSYANYYVC